jgi:hypothetical protein
MRASTSRKSTAEAAAETEKALSASWMDWVMPTAGAISVAAASGTRRRLVSVGRGSDDLSPSWRMPGRSAAVPQSR